MQPMGKRERLRQGEAVELKQGVWGRLNKDNRTLELDSGKVLPISQKDQQDLFPANEADLNVAKRTEALESEVKSSPFGEFGYQLGQSGIPNATKDWYNYLTKSGDEYLQDKEAQRRVSERISGESPWTSAAATATSFAPDLALTGGMSATAAAPLLTGLHAGPRILTEPGEVAKEGAVAAGLGKFIDIGGNALGKIAARRGASQALPEQQAAVRQANIAGEKAVKDANALQSQQFNVLKQDVKNFNEARLKAHQDELTTRQNEMIQATNEYETKKAARDAEIIRLKNEREIAKAQRSSNQAQIDAQYEARLAAAREEDKRLTEEFKRATKAYDDALKQMPELQKAAQAEYSANVVKNAEGISKSFPKDSKIYSSQFTVPEFLEESIQKSALAGSREANQASRIIKSLFPEGEILTAEELASRYKSLEGAIQNAGPEVREVLNSFKIHMGEKITPILADNLAFARIMREGRSAGKLSGQPALKLQLQKEVSSILDSMPLNRAGDPTREYLKKRIASNLDRAFREVSPENFIRKLESGELRQELIQKMANPSDFSVTFGAAPSGKKKLTSSLEEAEKMGLYLPPEPSSARYNEFVNAFSTKLDQILSKAEIKALGSDIDAARKLGAKVRNTYGTAPAIESPAIPIASDRPAMPTAPGELPPVAPIDLPPPISPAQVPPLPQKPAMLGAPTAPAPQNFVPAPEPTLPAASGMADKVGDFLEKDLLGGRTAINNPFTKLAGLKYALGKAALPLEAGYLGMKGLTSPTAAGEMARMTFKQGGIKAIDSWAQKYPSYQNGVLQSPQDRRSLTKEIEDDFSIPIEQKAILQSKVNRGRPLEAPL